MAINLLTTADTCVGTTSSFGGYGMATSWTLSGAISMYRGSYETDGYYITATLYWQGLTEYQYDAVDRPYAPNLTSV